MQLRRATAADAAALTANVAEGFSTYLEWAPPGWRPPHFGEEAVARLAARLAESEAWCTIALDAGEITGHAGLDSVTSAEPAPAPHGAIYLRQMFVRTHRHGSGDARVLVAAAVEEAARRGLTRMILWTPRGAARARRFYEREGFTATGREQADSHIGLPLVEYARAIEAS